ncbi:hypothetical protein SAMN06269301_2203 [Geobacter sp. DSM 9736]|nr:hypothetical protein SAMN06269301_2203 [Geobacter sp. DSM 9736]
MKIKEIKTVKSADAKAALASCGGATSGAPDKPPC